MSRVLTAILFVFREPGSFAAGQLDLWPAETWKSDGAKSSEHVHTYPEKMYPGTSLSALSLFAACTSSRRGSELSPEEQLANLCHGIRIVIYEHRDHVPEGRWVANSIPNFVSTQETIYLRVFWYSHFPQFLITLMVFTRGRKCCFGEKNLVLVLIFSLLPIYMFCDMSIKFAYEFHNLSFIAQNLIHINK